MTEFQDMQFRIIDTPIEASATSAAHMISRRHAELGGFVAIEGRVRNHHGGRGVAALEYSVYRELAEHEGLRIVSDVAHRFRIPVAIAIHRVGPVPIGEMAVWVYTGAAHREAAFTACRAIIDEIKQTVPIWKHEWYEDGTDEWVAGTSQPDTR
ncbi:MAG: molybdenum cofactor biosynthesis protein MoaE [Spirochaeta sp.]|jgi:molybdopterin synthase catalytic subunit|nr:molybdenum cofactor biosynthesis protein MoaE [Spirochaeta sp.]